MKEKCIELELKKQIENYKYCSKIYVPGYYNLGKKGSRKLRRSQHYRLGKGRDNHVKKFKKNKPKNFKKCKCFLCGQIGHYANECRSQNVRKDRISIYESLDLDKDWDIVSIEQDEHPEDSDVCNFYSDQEQDLENSN